MVAEVRRWVVASDQCVSENTMIEGGLEVKERWSRSWTAPLVRCRRSPRQFQNTMVGKEERVLAMEGMRAEGR